MDKEISSFARVPEHSLPLMRAMSGGAPFVAGEYLFFAAEDWLMAIGYPLRGKYRASDFEDALQKAKEKFSPAHCFAIAPELPDSYSAHIVDRDRYYLLNANAPVPAKLRNPLKKAAMILSVSQGNVFTPEHRRLWSEFLENPSSGMAERTRGLYLQTPAALAAGPGSLALLDARDSSGRLVASLLLDYAPKHFVSYVIGAHSRKFYVPHATDMLFSVMLQKARESGKRYIHLGMGVNSGILRFKLKWGAKPYFPYVLAQWQNAGMTRIAANDEPAGLILARALLSSPGLSARQAMGDQPSTKPFAMIWEVEKGGKISWVCGSAHFFCHSFEPSFRQLFKKTENVIFEGPLDNNFMAQVEEAGKKLPDGQKSLLDYMDAGEVENLEKTVFGSGGKLAACLNLQKTGRKIDVRHLLATGRYWYAFFTLWTAYLERRGWHESVDMEAWRVANDMNRNVIGMESLEEQLESLGSLPVERVLRFFRACGKWKKQASTNLHAYLAGDLERMMGSSAEFPTRTEHVVGRRDQRFRERMRPYLEKGGCAVFVGSAHMVNLRHMLAEDGFSVVQKPFGIWPKIHLGWRKLYRPDEKVKW